MNRLLVELLLATNRSVPARLPAVGSLHEFSDQATETGWVVSDGVQSCESWYISTANTDIIA